MPPPTIYFEMAMNYLFLDIDGVLNSLRSVHALGKYPHSHEPSQLPYFDKIALGLIQRLCEECEVSIVLSSSWRKGVDHIAVGKTLELPIRHATPELDGCRGDEIAHWLAEFFDPTADRYAIVDDDSDMLPEQRANFVKTSHNNGLLWENYLELKKILTS